MGVEKLEGTLPESQAISSSLLDGYFGALSQLAFETFISLLPILLAYLLFNIIALRQRKREIWSNIRGLIITYVGLVTFMLGVNGGFMDVGTQIGASLANLDSKIPVLIIALVLGLVTVLAEPAVHVLTHR